jgi:hypothetical protein
MKRTTSRSFLFSAFFVVVGAASSPAFAFDNNMDIVLDCITKHSGEAKAVDECAKSYKPVRRLAFLSAEHLVIGSPGAIGEGPPLEKRTTAAVDMWRINKDLRGGETQYFKMLMQSPDKNSFKFCGYKPMQIKNDHSGWQVLNPNDENVSVFTTVGGELIFEVYVRWLSKHAAGNSEKDIDCEGDGWRMTPSYESRLKNDYRDSSCALFVKLCYKDDAYGKRTSDVCGVCAGFATDW